MNTKTKEFLEIVLKSENNISVGNFLNNLDVFELDSIIEDLVKYKQEKFKSKENDDNVFWLLSFILDDELYEKILNNIKDYKESKLESNII